MDRPKLLSPHHRPLREGGGAEIPESGRVEVEIGGFTRVQIIQPDPYNGVLFLLPGLDPNGDVQQLPISRWRPL